MPEQPELRLMADFLNQYKNSTCYGTEKSEVTKITTPNIFQDCKFKGAESRGKELMLKFDLYNKDGYPENEIKYIFSMGMSGNWVESPYYLGQTEYPKHSHFRIVLHNQTICMVDPRRFAKWKIADDWSPKRSPDVIFDFDNAVRHYTKNVAKRKYDKVPIYELLMDQELFNGVGNYIRAEVLYRMNINPALTHWQVSTNYLFTSIYEVMEQAYDVGGMEYAAFKNPNKIEEPKNKGDWQVCYNKPNMSSIIDSKGRKFWYNPKWEI
jgi:endonuclease VIII-like 1